MGYRNFKKPFEFRSLSKVFYCGMTRLRNTYLSVFTQCQYTRTILRNKIMGQSLTLTWLNDRKMSPDSLKRLFK